MIYKGTTVVCYACWSRYNLYVPKFWHCISKKIEKPIVPVTTLVKSNTCVGGDRLCQGFTSPHSMYIKSLTNLEVLVRVHKVVSNVYNIMTLLLGLVGHWGGRAYHHPHSFLKIKLLHKIICVAIEYSIISQNDLTSRKIQNLKILF